MNPKRRNWLAAVARVSSVWAEGPTLTPAEKAVARSLSWFARNLYLQRQPSEADLAQIMLMTCHLCRGRSPEELAEAGCPEGACSLLPEGFSGHPYLRHLQLTSKRS